MDYNYPKISVILPLYKDYRFLNEAIDSVLNQTYKDLELIIICDNPDKYINEILNNYQKRDSRIRVYYCNQLGLTASLNLGCSVARGQYIARMDADDISLPDRLKKQLDFIESHPEIGIVGTWIQLIDERGLFERNVHFPTLHNSITFELIFLDCIAHPTVMMKRDIAKALGYYRLDANRCEDYDLWVRACLSTKIANMPEMLLKYRLHDKNVSKQNICNSIIPEIRYELIRQLGLKATSEDIYKLYKIESGLIKISIVEYEFAKNLIYDLKTSYINICNIKISEIKFIKKTIAKQFFFLAFRALKESKYIIALKFLFHGFLNHNGVIIYIFLILYDQIISRILKLRSNLENVHTLIGVN